MKKVYLWKDITSWVQFEFGIIIMTSEKIIDFGIKNGFNFAQNKPLNTLTLNRADGINVELYFPDEKELSKMDDGTNINWEYKLIDNKTGTELYKEWIDIYSGTAKEKIERVKGEVFEFMNKILTHKITVNEKFTFSMFGLKFLKYKELVFIK